jgi:hypothetical protein
VFAADGGKEKGKEKRERKRRRKKEKEKDFPGKCRGTRTGYKLLDLRAS